MGSSKGQTQLNDFHICEKAGTSGRMSTLRNQGRSPTEGERECQQKGDNPEEDELG